MFYVGKGQRRLASLGPQSPRRLFRAPQQPTTERLPAFPIGCRGGNRTPCLVVMSHPSYRCSTLLNDVGKGRPGANPNLHDLRRLPDLFCLSADWLWKIAGPLVYVRSDV